MLFQRQGRQRGNVFDGVGQAELSAGHQATRRTVRHRDRGGGNDARAAASALRTRKPARPKCVGTKMAHGAAAQHGGGKGHRSELLRKPGLPRRDAQNLQHRVLPRQLGRNEHGRDRSGLHTRAAPRVGPRQRQRRQAVGLFQGPGDVSHSGPHRPTHRIWRADAEQGKEGCQVLQQPREHPIPQGRCAVWYALGQTGHRERRPGPTG